MKIIWYDDENDDDKFYQATILPLGKVINVIFWSGQKGKTFKLPWKILFSPQLLRQAEKSYVVLKINSLNSFS